MKKAIFIMLIGLLLTGAAFSQGTLFTGEVIAQDDTGDGGNSVANVTIGTRDGVPSYRFTGRIGPGRGAESYITLVFEPDDAFKEALKNANTISFKVLGDGNRFRMEYRTDAVRDWGFHMAIFSTDAGQVKQISLRNRTFQQPGWATMVRLNPARATSLSVILDDSAKDGRDIDITIFDLRVQ